MSPTLMVSQALPAAGPVTIGRSSRNAVRIEDPLASREHACLHVDTAPDGLALAIEDVGSANGTRVRDQIIAPGDRVSLVIGEAVRIGDTVLMVLRDRPTAPRRIWDHPYFECRVEDECARAATTGSAFALVRLRFSETDAAPIQSILARDLAPRHVLANYGPKDHEILFVDVKPGEPERLVDELLRMFREARVECAAALAWYPKDGRTCDELFEHAHSALKGDAGRHPNEGAGRAANDVAPMQRVRDMVIRAASSSINVLVLGETGVGKELLARQVHKHSPRAAMPLVAVNCAALSETLIESELFGYEKGAFTGASATKVGLLESANGGTVFLDEIGEMSLATQSKLLRVIEAREVMPVGAVRPRPIDVRFVSATHRDLEISAAKGEFRHDLFYRLNGISLLIPPLRERKDEIPELVASFIAQVCGDPNRRSPPRVSGQAMKALLAYAWPGNIRELRNVIERALVLCDGPNIGLEHLPLEKMQSPAERRFTQQMVTPPREMGLPFPSGLPPLPDAKKSAERQRILDALTACNGNQTRAARLVGVSRRTFVTKLDEFGIPRPQKGAQPGNDDDLNDDEST
jgi:DNA-binding NtrC family response regulator